MTQDGKTRCAWAYAGELDRAYHDGEWGIPQHDERHLFEMLILEGLQAGLSWTLILKKREALRAAFDNFEPAVIAGYGEEKIQALMANPRIIRNRRKIDAAIINAKAYAGIVREYGSLDHFLWRYVDSKPILGHWPTMADVPVTTELARAISRDMQALGMKFVGPTIVYSLMQAIGMVNDHIASCYCHSRKS